MTRPLAQWICLALVVEGHRHGWTIGRALAPDGEIGEVWTLSRPLTYRAIDALVEDGLLERGHPEPGRGGTRLPLTATTAGRRALRTWFRSPTRHLRDVRTELMVKLRLMERRGLDPAPLLEHQLAEMEPLVDAVTAAASDDAWARWRRTQAQAILGFVRQELAMAQGI